MCVLLAVVPHLLTLRLPLLLLPQVAQQQSRQAQQAQEQELLPEEEARVVEEAMATAQIHAVLQACTVCPQLSALKVRGVL